MNEESAKSKCCEPKESNLSLEGEIEKGKNKHLVKCKFCPSKILNPKMGTYLTQQFELPMMTRKKKTDESLKEIQYETLTHFWQINDMYTFENISFSNAVENTKYLACADCEIGPVGYFNLDTKLLVSWRSQLRKGRKENQQEMSSFLELKLEHEVCCPTVESQKCYTSYLTIYTSAFKDSIKIAWYFKEKANLEDKFTLDIYYPVFETFRIRIFC